MIVFLVFLSIVAVFGLIAAGFAYVFSTYVLHPVRQPIVRTPREYGLDYEDVEFTSTDGVTLKGWLIPGRPADENARVIIMAHAMHFNRHGFSARYGMLSVMRQPDVDFLPLARVLSQCGYALLMFDLRNHGESGKGGVFGGGLNEYQDVVGALKYINDRYVTTSPQTGLIGFCAGANSIIVAASRAKTQMNSVKFLVLVQPISGRVLARCFTKSLLTPLGLLLVPFVNRFCQWRGGYAFEAISPATYAGDIDMPTLYVQAKADRFTELSDIKRMCEATSGPKELWVIEGKMKRFDTYNYLGAQPERLVDFAGKHLPGQPREQVAEV